MKSITRTWPCDVVQMVPSYQMKANLSKFYLPMNTKDEEIM